MSLNLVSMLASWENLLFKNNTTTATIDISNGLNERVVSFRKGVRGFHSTCPIPKTQYPVIFVELDTKDEDFAQLGNSNNRNVEINFQIIPVIDYGKGGAYGAGESRELSGTEIITLTQNIEALLRTKITLSGTVDYCNITSTDYNVVLNEPKSYNSVSKINVMATKLTT